MKKYFVLLLMLSCVAVKAQKPCIPVPDSLGKTLATVFLNKEDISKMPIFPNAKEMEIIDRIEGLSQPIAVEASADQSPAPFNQILTSWQMLLQLAKIKSIGAANSTYSNTYFEKKDLEFENKKADHYTVYVVFKQATQKIAVKFDLIWRQDKWLLINVDHDFYTYKVASKNRSPFIAKGWDESVQLTGSAVTYSAAISQKKSGWTTKGTCLVEPMPFINGVLQDLANKQPVAKFSNLISAENFKQHYQPDLQSMVNEAAKKLKSMSASEQKELRSMQLMFKENPTGLYKEYVTNNIEQLTEYLSSVKFTSKNVKTITYNMSNFDYEVWTAGKILMKVDVTLKTTAGDEGIQFMAGWHNNQWQLMYMQSTTYGISAVE